MNGSKALIQELVSAITNQQKVEPGSVVICPPFLLVSSLLEATKDTGIGVGAQNVHTELSGAYTGETSTPLLQELGIGYCIVGHSERREYFGEDDVLVNLKIKRLLEANIVPIYCVGELLEQREQNQHESTVIAQMKDGLKDLSADDLRRCVIAYEPVWAIGTGKTATPEQANSMHTVIRKQIAEIGGEDVAQQMQILYGGSVKGANANDLLGQSDIDGALVGGASLKADEFCKIIAAAS